MIAEGLVPLRVPGLDFSGLGVLVAEGLSSRNTRPAHAKTLPPFPAGSVFNLRSSGINAVHERQRRP